MNSNPICFLKDEEPMLYKLKLRDEAASRIEPLPFFDLSGVGKREKDLENLLADHILDVLFEDAPLMPIFQERAWQSEADLYALNENGDLIIFELKLNMAGGGAVQQVLHYTQDAGQWTFRQLAEKYAAYIQSDGDAEVNLRQAHCEAFQLERELQINQFNQRQHMVIIGSAADDELVKAVDYWIRQGLSISFVPYRLYRIADDLYFEFFSMPYDQHRNPDQTKGVLFDTNRSYSETNVWDMIEKKRVAAYGDVSYFAEYLNPGDIVFYSHKGYGLIGAGEVIGPTKEDGPHEKYHDVRFLTAVPNREGGIQKAMPFSDVSAITGKSFFWARTLKVPYLSRDEANDLLEALNEVLNGKSGE